MTISLPEAKSLPPPKGFHALAIAAVKRLTHQSVHLIFRIPEELAEHFRFRPGQHIDLILMEDGEPFRRSYSICSGPTEPMSIAVKAIENGKASIFINASIRPGDVLWVSEPKGSFVLSETAKKIVLIAAGSGITPLLAMAKSAVQRDVDTTLVYGNRTQSSTMFLNEIAALKSLRVVHYLSAEPMDGANYGRIDQRAVCEQAVKEAWAESADAFYVCGPSAMADQVKTALIELGVAAERVHVELFSAAESSANSDQECWQGPCRIRVRLEGDTYEFDIASGGSNVLAEAIKAGLDAPYSCKTGVCGSCRAKLLSGTVEMKSNYALTDDEVADGFILTCQATPSSASVSISYDV
jgi:ring-1,2-phenylacetyl-CoA epoxidase subunit PaaE